MKTKQKKGFRLIAICSNDALNTCNNCIHRILNRCVKHGFSVSILNVCKDWSGEK